MDPNIDVDDVLRGLGKWGTYQKIQLGFLLVAIWPCAFQLLTVVFIGYRPPFQCKEVDDVSPFVDDFDSNGSYFVEYDKCKIKIFRNDSNSSFPISTQACPNVYTYAIPKDRTFVTEWDLVCDNAELAELTQTLMMLGQAIGAGLAAALADRFGRKIILIISHIALFSFGLGLAFAPSYPVFAFLRFFVGFFQQGLGVTAAIIILEILPRESRLWMDILGLFFWTTGGVILSSFGYFLQDFTWRYFQIAISLISIFSLIHYWIQDESIRWLVINGKTKEAERIIRKAAKLNKIKFDDVMDHVQRMKNENHIIDARDKNTVMNDNGVYADGTGNKNDVPGTATMLNSVNADNFLNEDDAKETAFKVEHYSILTLLKEPRVLIISLIMWFAWITNSLTYFGLALTSSSLAGNRFLNFFLTAAVEYPAIIIEYFTLNSIGRKITAVMFHTVAAISLLIATLLKTFQGTNYTMGIFSTVFTLLGKMGITGSFSTIYLYTPELYPTNLRNVGIGFASGAARFGGMVAPFAGILATYIAWGPGAIFAAMCLIVSCLLLYLPETAGYELPQTMTEVKMWYKQHSGTKKKKKRPE